jgi:predicted RNA binding protein YcfA (HicA-like mRNA interferase family)
MAEVSHSRDEVGTPLRDLGPDDLRVKFREILRLLEEDGWQLMSQRGSHPQYKHPRKPGKVTVAGRPGADIQQAPRPISCGKRV